MTIPTEDSAAGPNGDLSGRRGGEGQPPGGPLTDEHRRFLAAHARGFLIVTGADGGPIGYPMTVRWCEGTLEFNTYRRSAKVIHLRRDGRVCVVVVPRDRAADRRVLSVWGRVQPGEGSIEHWMHGDGEDSAPGLSAPARPLMPQATPSHAATPPVVTPQPATPHVVTPPHVVARVRERLLDGRRIIIRVTPLTALFMHATEGPDDAG
ncbi:Pyridoxamine 5'-phosphate oxidase [Frankia torreyi]|uniref:Pyridoxamine 5'-phosphate oxidase n=1 Tax=Frankia torreyi TaxID=1856 RepID=A0A0D8B8T8_9ACTN|nr:MULTISPECIES: pyridoxamine 5'-phosphate oxidase family protein [Frankia]KJE20616.1 Pyridoxamine 5'-phosphate oxidase [Frankia torreyi]KQM02906.1 Pyridoxamine 5'-phosphate oxidase [Frankia sp. CpI1-P]